MQHRLWRALLVVLLASILVPGSNLLASTFMRADIEDLVRQNSIVVVAEVIDTESFWNEIGWRSLHEDDRDALRCAYDRYHPCTGPPATPSYISGPNQDLCQGATETYMTGHIPGADRYRWEVVGTFFSATTSNNEVSLPGMTFTPGFYQIRVRAQNDCGSSAWRNANLIVRANSDPICGGCSGRFCF